MKNAVYYFPRLNILVCRHGGCASEYSEEFGNGLGTKYIFSTNEQKIFIGYL